MIFRRDLVCVLGLVVATACGRPLPPPLAAIAPDPTPVATARPPVGMESRVFADPARNRELATMIWYPAAPGAAEQDVEWDGIFIGRGAWQAPLRATPRRWPVVLLSHGSGADASSLTWLAEALASRGYLAVAVDHPGDRFGDTSVEGRFAAWRRPRDVSVVLDRMLVDPTFGPRIDRGRIAAAGHSSGAYTALALAGLRLEPRAYLRYCAQPERGPDCELFAGLEPARIPDLARARASRRDRRIRAVLALAPVLGPAAIPASLRAIEVPVRIVASSADEYVPFERNALRYQRGIRRATLKTVPDAGHFVFMPRCTLPGTIVASQVCVDRSPTVDRGAVHDEVATAALRFFDTSLRVPRSKR